MRYEINRKLMIINFIICLLLLVVVVRNEGIDVITKKTIITKCQDSLYAYADCQLIDEQGKAFTLARGENITSNYHPPDSLKLANQGIPLTIIITLIINHFLYNRKYPVKKKIKQFLSSLPL